MFWVVRDGVTVVEALSNYSNQYHSFGEAKAAAERIKKDTEVNSIIVKVESVWSTKTLAEHFEEKERG